jgi:hypothetical protein
MCLYHPDVEEYIEQSNARSITSYISSHRKATANSIKKWATTSHIGVTSIVGWIRRSNSNAKINIMYSRQRRSLLDVSRKKERLRFKRLRREAEATRRQASIAGYYTLTQSVAAPSFSSSRTMGSVSTEGLK